MTQAVYLPYKTSILSGDASTDLIQNTTTDGPYTALLNTTSYVFANTHQFYSQLIGSPDAVVGTDQRIASPTVGTPLAGGTFDGNDLTYTAVSGPTIGAFAIYRHNSGANNTWRLVLYEDSGVTGLPVVPNGGNITVTWNAGGIFQISDAERKEDIRRVGSFGKAELYSFRYRGERMQRIGLIAQQIEQFAQHAVRWIDGCKRVDYAAALLAA